MQALVSKIDLDALVNGPSIADAADAAPAPPPQPVDTSRQEGALAERPHTQGQSRCQRPATSTTLAAATKTRPAEASARRACSDVCGRSGDSARGLAAYTRQKNAGGRRVTRDSSSAEHTGGASDSCASNSCTSNGHVTSRARFHGLGSCGGMKAGVANDYGDEGEGNDMGGENMGVGEPKGASTLLKEYEELIPDLYLEIESLRAELDQEREQHAAQRMQMLEEHKKVQAVLAANETVQHLTCHNRQQQDKLDLVQNSLNLAAVLETTGTQAKENKSSTRSLDSLRMSLAKPHPRNGLVDDVQPESGAEKGGRLALDDSSDSVGSLSLSQSLSVVVSASLSLSLSLTLFTKRAFINPFFDIII